MTPKIYVYFEPDTYNFGGYIHYYCKDKLKTYPEVLRFTSHSDIQRYYKARQEFIQSTKIPESCDKCPIVLHCKGIYQMNRGTETCRKTWRKIWEYVK